MNKKEAIKKLQQQIKAGQIEIDKLEKLAGMLGMTVAELKQQVDSQEWENTVNTNYEKITQGGIIMVDQTQPPQDPDCPPGQHKDPTTGQCVPDTTEPPGGGTAEKDIFGISFFHKLKQNGFKYEMSEDPKNDQALDVLDEHYTVSNDGTHTVITMKPDGPTSLGVGRHVREEKEPEGGCDMDFKKMESQMWTCFEDDVRDLEYKCIMRIKDLGDHGFSMSCCTNRHTSSDCCQGFAYMCNIEDPTAAPTTFRFRKEMLHVSYHNSPEGIWTHPASPNKLDGNDWFGFGVCRYNSADNKKVFLEMWFCPPGKDYKERVNWTCLKKIEDFNGNGWGDDGDKCNGVKDQYGPWSGRQNRLKTNATSGSVDFKCISFVEILPELAI